MTTATGHAPPTWAQALWPGATLETGGSRAPVRYLAGPSATDPRFLLPPDRRSAAAVLRFFRSPGDRGSRLRLAALRGAVRTTGGWPALHPMTVTSDGRETVEAWVEQALGEPTTLGIHLGHPRANRKAILQVLDGRDRPLAVGKVATNPLTAGLVRAEARALSVLGEAAPSTVRVPRLRHAGTLHGRPVVLMSHLPVQRAASPVDERRRTAAMVSLSRCLGSRRSAPADSGIHHRLRTVALALPVPEVREGCLRAVDRLAAVAEPWDIGCWHGDWTEWNMAALDDDVLVWDWERFDADVPVGWDALHYELRRDIAQRGPVPAVTATLLARAPDLLRPFGVTPSAAQVVTVAYLVALALRYTADGQRLAGGRSAYVEDWLLPVVAEWRGLAA